MGAGVLAFVDEGTKCVSGVCPHRKAMRFRMRHLISYDSKQHPIKRNYLNCVNNEGDNLHSIQDMLNVVLMLLIRHRPFRVQSAHYVFYFGVYANHKVVILNVC